MADSGTSLDSDLHRALANEEGVGEVLFSSADITKRVAEIGQQITQDYAGRTPVIVIVLKGGMMFASDLCRVIDLPVEIDFMAVSSYGNNSSSSGVVRIMKDLDIDISGRDVIVVEDIVDSGLTLQYLRKSLNARNPASLAVCSLLLRESNGGASNGGGNGSASNGGGKSSGGNGVVVLDVDYVGFELPPVWVVGYGLDLAQRYRNLPDIRAYDGKR